MYHIARFNMVIFTALDILQFHCLKWLISFLTNSYCFRRYYKIPFANQLRPNWTFCIFCEDPQAAGFSPEESVDKAKQKTFHYALFYLLWYLCYIFSINRASQKSYPFQIYWDISGPKWSKISFGFVLESLRIFG